PLVVTSLFFGAPSQAASAAIAAASRKTLKHRISSLLIDAGSERQPSIETSIAAILSLFLTASAGIRSERSPRHRARRLTLLHDQRAVDDHVMDALGIAARIFVGGGVAERVGIENHQVGHHTGADNPAIPAAKPPGGRRGHLADALLPGQQPQ